jgi:hypothetical protein
MIDVKLSKPKEKIALIHVQESGEAFSVTFPYQQSQEITNRVKKERGVFFGKISLALAQDEIEGLVQKITKAYDEIKSYLSTEFDIDPYFSKTNQKWVVKISNRIGNVRFLTTETVNGFLMELQKTKAIAFRDKTSVSLSDAKLEALMSQLVVVSEAVIGENQPHDDEDPDSHQTVVVNF